MQNLDLLFCSKGYFVIVFKDLEDRKRVFDWGPWFWGYARLSIQPWFPEFNPLSMKTLANLVWVRLSNLPLQLIRLDFLEVIGKDIGHFVIIDNARLDNGFISFVCIYVELDLSVGLSNKIILKWNDKEHHQPLDYENATFRCRSC